MNREGRSCPRSWGPFELARSQVEGGWQAKCGASEDERESRMLGSTHLDGENMPELLE